MAFVNLANERDMYLNFNTESTALCLESLGQYDHNCGAQSSTVNIMQIFGQTSSQTVSGFEICGHQSIAALTEALQKWIPTGASLGFQPNQGKNTIFQGCKNFFLVNVAYKHLFHPGIAKKLLGFGYFNRKYRRLKTYFLIFDEKQHPENIWFH